MENIHSPLPLIFRHHVPVQNWEAIKEKIDNLLDAMDERHPLEQNASQSTYDVAQNGNAFNLLTWDCLKYLEPEIWKAVIYATKQWHLDYNKFEIAQCWSNRHKHTGKTAFHKHGVYTQYVIAYYLSVPENSGDLLIIDPMEYHWNSYNSKMIDECNTWGWRQKVKTGDMVIMPNFLIHGTDENRNLNEDRYVLTLNVSGFNITDPKEKPSETDQV